jgi:hypothetical protein
MQQCVSSYLLALHRHTIPAISAAPTQFTSSDDFFPHQFLPWPKPNMAHASKSIHLLQYLEPYLHIAVSIHNSAFLYGSLGLATAHWHAD